MGVNKLFARGLSLYPDRTCLKDADTERSYADVDARRRGIVGALLEDGFAPGERCAVLSPNCVAAFECMLGIYRADGVFVPLNSKNPASDSIAVINLCDVTTLFFHDSLSNHIGAIRKACPSVVRTICLNAETPDAPPLDRWIALSDKTLPDVSQDFQRLVSIYSTGGTTGASKGVMFSPLTWEIMAANFFAAIPESPNPVFLVVPPLTHAAGTIAILMMARGATIVIQDHFDAAAVSDVIAREKVTDLYLPPTAIYMLLAYPLLRQHDFSSLKNFIYTSAPMSVSKLKQCLDIFGPMMVQFWGQTEAPIFCTALLQADHIDADDRRLSSCGRPMLLTPVDVMDDDGQLLAAGEHGELVVRGNLVMTGYFKNADASADASRFGWHHTGDVGYKDEQGFIYIVDRKKDMIISGGFNVYPSEVEQIIMTVPSVQDCAVIGVPDDKWGEAVTAVVQLKPDQSADENDLIALCKMKLGSVKAPKAIAFWPELPKTNVGKIDKKKIRSQFWANTGRSI